MYRFDLVETLQETDMARKTILAVGIVLMSSVAGAIDCKMPNGRVIHLNFAESCQHDAVQVSADKSIKVQPIITSASPPAQKTSQSQKDKPLYAQRKRQ